MRVTLTSLNEALQDNLHLIEDLLQQQQYDEAVLCMDNRLALIDQLAQLAKECPMQQQAVAELAATLSLQEESMKILASHHHQSIVKELSSIGLANKAKQVYSVNSKEF